MKIRLIENISELIKFYGIFNKNIPISFFPEQGEVYNQNINLPYIHYVVCNIIIIYSI